VLSSARLVTQRMETPAARLKPTSMTLERLVLRPASAARWRWTHCHSRHLRRVMAD